MVGVVFYYGTTIPALLVRIRTRLRGQKFADVPAHVGIIAGTHPAYFEAIVSGVHSDSTIPSSLRPMQISVANEAALVAYLRDQVGDRYDWAAIMDDAVGEKLPWDLLINPHRKRAADCSGLVLDALLVGGVQIEPDRLPETPNDLLFALRELSNGVGNPQRLGASLSHQGQESPERQKTMFAKLRNWIYNRALRLSHSATVSLAKATDQTPATIEALNNAGAGFVENLVPNA
jgi:hypothetical protein